MLRLACALTLVLAVACKANEPEWMQRVEQAHAVADGANSEPERVRAMDQLEAAYSDVPESDVPGVRWVRQDLCARLAELGLARGDAALALQWSDKGLAVSEEGNVARADLLRLRGLSLEALGRKEEAAATLFEALKVNQELMERALRGDVEERSTR